jgi:hypothetical protein
MIHDSCRNGMQHDSTVEKDKLKRRQKFISATLRIIPQNKITQTGTTNGSSPSTTNCFAINRLLARNLIEAPKERNKQHFLKLSRNFTY